MGFSYFGTGSLNFKIGSHNGQFTAERPLFYSNLLNDAKALDVILQDEQSRRAWQTDGERIILHMILHQQEKGDFTLNKKLVELRAAEPTYASSVRQAMNINANVIMIEDYHLEKREATKKLFIDMASELFSRLELLKAHSRETIDAGIELRLEWERRIQGFEYMDLIEKRPTMFIKETELESTCGKWPTFARQNGALILLGEQFGEVFRPSLRNSNCQLCPTFRTMPRGKDFLSIEVSTLQQMYIRQGSRQTQQKLTAYGMQWKRSSHLFESCPLMKRSRFKKGAVCTCLRIQEFALMNASRQPPGPLEHATMGVALFGHISLGWFNDFKRSFESSILGTSTIPSITGEIEALPKLPRELGVMIYRNIYIIDIFNFSLNYL